MRFEQRSRANTAQEDTKERAKPPDGDTKRSQIQHKNLHLRNLTRVELCRGSVWQRNRTRGERRRLPALLAQLTTLHRSTAARWKAS